MLAINWKNFSKLVFAVVLWAGSLSHEAIKSWRFWFHVVYEAESLCLITGWKVFLDDVILCYFGVLLVYIQTAPCCCTHMRKTPGNCILKLSFRDSLKIERLDPSSGEISIHPHRWNIDSNFHGINRVLFSNLYLWNLLRYLTLVELRTDQYIKGLVRSYQP